MCGGTTIDKIAGAAPFTCPAKNTLSSILLTPHCDHQGQPRVVLDAKWIDKATLCQGVTAGSVAGC